MRLNPEALLPQNPDTVYAKALNRSLKDIFRALIQKVNAIADGGISAIDNAATAAPTSGTWRQGDFIRNSEPAEAGAGGSMYVVTGFVCTVSGAPGTWLECRSLTGN